MSTIDPSDPNIVYSPYNWKVAAGLAKTICAGAYFRVTFTGTPTTLTAAFDVSAMPTGANRSRVGFRVDGGPWQDYACAASVALTLPTGNTWGKHTVEMVVISSTEAVDRWNSQLTAVNFLGLTGDVTLTTVATRTRDLYVLAFGDSITEGVRALNMTATGDPNRNDSRLAWAHPLTGLLGAEVGVVGFGGTGLAGTGSGNVPEFDLSLPYLWNGEARSLAGRAPDVVIGHVGTNDSGKTDAAVTASTTALCNWLIANTPSKTRIFILPGWLQVKAAAIQAGIAACTAPARIRYVDTTGWWSTADSADSLHPYGYINISDLAPRLAATVRARLGSGAYRRASDGSAVPI